MSTELESSKFFELLSTVTNEDTFDVLLSNNKTCKFKHLTAIHLKELIETVIDTSLTKNKFDEVSSKIFKECLVSDTDVSLEQFNVIDRLLFVIESRINAISPHGKILKEDESEPTPVDLADIKNKLIKAITSSPEIFAEKKLVTPKMTVVCQIPTLAADSQLNALNKKEGEIDLESEENVQKLLGDAFIHEIAKCVKEINIGENSIVLSVLTFEERTKLIESLPASIVNEIIDYIEKYKNVIDECMRVQSITFTPDGSLFSVR
jgi:hypothetical protein